MSGTKIEKAVIKKGAENTNKKARNITKSGYYEIRINWNLKLYIKKKYI